MKIVLNGEDRLIPPRANVLTMLAALAIDPSRVAVELNRQIVRQTAWSTTEVPDGASVEVVQFVGGG